MEIPTLALELLAAAPPPPVFDDPDLSGELPFFANPITTLRNWAAEFLVEISIVGVIVSMVMLIVGNVTGRAWAGAIGLLIAVVVAVIVGLNSGTFLNYFVTQPSAEAAAFLGVLPPPSA